MELVKQGKVRDVYADGADLILVASDRISVYDVILPTIIPDKGAILTQLSLWFFRQISDIVPNHVIDQQVPSEWAGRALRCQKLNILPVECIARGYLVGHGLKAYQETGNICGVELPAGLVEAAKLPEPIFTPSTKAELGAHDELVSAADVAQQIGTTLTQTLLNLTLKIYQRGAEIAIDRGVIVADTKFEFGTLPSGELVLADEVFTPDSSRFWDATKYEPGRPQYSYDKQVVRDWARSTGWDLRSPGPEVPAEIVAETRARYIRIYEQLTNEKWVS